MPLLRQIPLIRKKVPTNLSDDTPVFFLELTGEVFTEYEEFCDRIIQCNSMIWTCAETGKTELTLSEALKSENDARQMLKSFPETLKVPALYLASIAESTDLQEVVIRVYNYMVNRFFKNEVVMPKFKEKWKEGKITAVASTKQPNSKSSKISRTPMKPIPPSHFLYDVEVNVNENKSDVLQINGAKLKRPREASLSKDMLWVFLKHNAVLNARGIWVIKGSVLQKYNIQHIKFQDLFCGDPPMLSRKINGKINQRHSLGNNRKVSQTKDKSVDLSKTDKGALNESGQQNIEKYFSLSRKSDYKGEPENGKITSLNPEIRVDLRNSDNEIDSSDEINVVYSSSVKHKRFTKKECAEAFRSGKQSGKSRKKFGEVTVNKLGNRKSVSRRNSSFSESGDKSWRSEHANMKTLSGEDSKKRKSSETDDSVAKTPKMEDSFESEESSFQKKKFKQTRIFDKLTDQPENYTRKKSEGKLVPDSVKKGSKKEIVTSKRKQKIVATLKPWIQTAKKDFSTSEKPKQDIPKEKKNWPERQREIDNSLNFLKQERAREKAKHDEEKLMFSKFMKEWRKVREDLLCENLRPLPVLCEINFRIPNELFGDFMVVLEFMHSFKSILQVKQWFRAGGLTFELLERALVENEIAGPLNDIIHVLLAAIFDFQIQEHRKPKSGVPVTVDLNLHDFGDEDITPQGANPHFIAATGWSNIFKDLPLHDVPINHVTISEILRLHLLWSGGRGRDVNADWLIRRGSAGAGAGYTNFEDPGLWLRMEKPQILKNLSCHHVCELSIGEKLDILNCLVSQVLTYAQVRYEVENRSEQSRKAKLSLKSSQIAEYKLQKDITARRIQGKKDAKLAKDNPATVSVTQDSTVAESQKTEKKEKEIVKLQAEIKKKNSVVLPLLMSHQLLPLGRDRAHRNFWMFSSLPGLFVEYHPFEIGPCLPKPTPVFSGSENTEAHVRNLFREEFNVPKGYSAISKKNSQKKLVENLGSLERRDASTEKIPEDKEFLICTASRDCPVHHPKLCASRWSFFTKTEELPLLIEQLNERGLRENALRRVLVKEEERIMESISQCPLYKLNPEKFMDTEMEPRKTTRSNSGYDPEAARLNYPSDVSVSYIMEMVLREFILELESKINSACVGSLKVFDRTAWRAAIENGKYDKQCDKLQWGIKIRSLKKGTNEEGGGDDIHMAEEEDAKSEDISTQGTNEVGGGDDIYMAEEEDAKSEDIPTQEMCPTHQSEAEVKAEMQNEPLRGSPISDHFSVQNSNDATSEIGEAEDDSKSTSSASESKCLKTGDSCTINMDFKNLPTSDVTNSENNDSSEINAKQDVSHNDDSTFYHSASDSETYICSNTSSLKVDSCNKAGASDTSSEMSDGECISSEEINNKLNEKNSELIAHPNDLREKKSPEKSRFAVDQGRSSDKCTGEDMNFDTKFCNSEDVECNSRNDPSAQNPVVKDLACALLQLGQSLDVKFLQKPLAEEDHTKMTPMKYWEVALMNVVNFSQLFIHHSILEDSINWSASALYAPCCICKRRGNAEKMLLCDGCNKGHHMYCLRPKLTTIPNEDWYCPTCAPVEKSPIKEKKKKNVLENNDNIANLSGLERIRNRKRKVSVDEENEPMLSKQTSKTRQINDLNDCHKCGRSGQLVFCSVCSEAYHQECLSSTNKPHFQQKENWKCESCRLKDQSELSTRSPEGMLLRTTVASGESDDESVIQMSEGSEVSSEDIYNSYCDDQSDSSEPSGRGRRGCATATIAKIASFTKRLRSNSWEDSEGHSRRGSASFSIHDNSGTRRSSRKALTASGDLPLDNALLQGLVKEMLQHGDSWPFLRPVRKSEVPDYHQIIKKPMDLGTVKYKLNTAEYKSNREFISDVLLVFENCKMYNKCDAVEYKCGTKMDRFFKRRISELGLE